MGTRAITNVMDESGAYYVSLYRQFDGYPYGGHGEELAEFLNGAVIGNGISSNPPAGFFNGVGDLALRLVSFFKSDHRNIGGFYLEPPSEDNKQEFTYTIIGYNPSYTIHAKEDPKPIRVIVENYERELFDGSVEEFQVWVSQPLDEEEDEDY